jgi:hypothetical protein
MSVGRARPPSVSGKAAHLQELELLPMCRRWSGPDAGQVDRDQPPAMMQGSMTPVMTRARLRALRCGGGLFRLRRRPRHWHDAS